MAERTIAEVFPPGEIIREELEARGWTQLDLADILARPPRLVNEIIGGKRGITPETAKALGEAFGTEPEFWMNLESSYQLHRAKAIDHSIGRRASLYAKAPVKEIIRRKWIEDSESIDVLEKRVEAFLSNQPAVWAYAARQSTDYGDANPAQKAWVLRVRHLATAAPITRTLSRSSLEAALLELTALKRDAEEVRHVPKILANAGIRFLIVEHLQHTKIDGVCLWLDQDSPVIALSMRYDRIDWFWHTLMHEMGHVLNKDGVRQPTVDTNLVGSDAQPFEGKPPEEKKADEFAVNFLINQKELDNFIARVHPLYSHSKIVLFSNRIGVHPGIVVGQLHHRNKISWAHSRKMLEKVKEIIVASALTDGWGHMIQA